MNTSHKTENVSLGSNSVCDDSMTDFVTPNSCLTSTNRIARLISARLKGRAQRAEQGMFWRMEGPASARATGLELSLASGQGGILFALKMLQETSGDVRISELVGKGYSWVQNIRRALTPTTSGCLPGFHLGAAGWWSVQMGLSEQIPEAKEDKRAITSLWNQLS